LERNNTSLGAGFVEHNGASYVVRASGLLTDPAQLADIAIAERDGTPVRVRDVAVVATGAALRTGSATENGEEVVLATAIMLLGANSRTVSQAAHAKLEEVAATLPADVRVETVLDRTTLVDATIRTVVTNLAEGALLVVVVLFLLLGNIRAALITALAIPLSMLLTAIGMLATNTSGNLMSLGAIDFGLIVDGAVIIVENCLRRLAERQQALGRTLTEAERLTVVRDASHQVRGATAFGEAIIIVVYVPILFLTGVEGRMFRPMAMTVIFALLAAFLLSLTFVPAMVAMLLRGRLQERELWVVRACKALYAPAVRWALRWRVPVVAGAVALSLGALALFGRLGQEFAPTLGELDLLVQAFRVPSVSVREATVMQRQIEKTVAALPEVAVTFSRTGTAEIAFDPMPPYLSDLYVMLRPRAEWPDPSETKADVAARVAARINSVPGAVYSVSQPIEERFGELLAGVRGDVAVKVFGDDFDALIPVARHVAAALRAVPGADSVRVEPVSGAPVLEVNVDRNAIGRYGLSVADVQEVVAVAVGGRPAGAIYEGDRRFDVVVRLPERLREDIAALERLPIALSHQDTSRTSLALGGDDLGRAPLRFVPLDAVADVRLTEGPNQISRDNGKRRIVVTANVRERDIGSFVEEAQRRVAAEVAVPPGSWLTWGGQYENLVQAKRRLAVVVPICFAVILLLLFGTFGSWPAAAVVFSGVPLALSGGVVALWLRDLPFSISAAVGFIALSGVAVLNGLVMITFINQLRAAGTPTFEAIARGAVTRLRPVLVTALVASLGFLPMALATGTGAEVQRPLATVVIGGLATSTLLTLFVLPALYSLLANRIKTAPDGDAEPTD
ncbi:MAG: CusA/CzcA family heavy metal efflux RND transporter, partial [bacterium]